MTNPLEVLEGLIEQLIAQKRHDEIKSLIAALELVQDGMNRPNRSVSVISGFDRVYIPLQEITVARERGLEIFGLTYHDFTWEPLMDSKVYEVTIHDGDYYLRCYAKLVGTNHALLNTSGECEIYMKFEVV